MADQHPSLGRTPAPSATFDLGFATKYNKNDSQLGFKTICHDKFCLTLSSQKIIPHTKSSVQD